MAKTDEYLTVKEASEYLAVAPNTLRNWGASGKIPEYRHPLNNYRLFRMTDLETLRRRIEEPKVNRRANLAARDGAKRI